LPWDVVPAASYERLDRVKAYLGALRARSDRRLATEKPFADLREDVARLKKDLAIKSVTLNEGERREEMAQSKAREAQLARDERALQASAPTSYEITLKNASSPGLPSPLASTEKAAAKAVEGPTSALATLGNEMNGRSTTQDLILDEGVRILADYVDLLKAAPRAR
jgi:hypothetical protein